jgi:hypothetical protein
VRQMHRLLRVLDSAQTGRLTERDFRALVFLNDALPPRTPPPFGTAASAAPSIGSAAADAKSTGAEEKSVAGMQFSFLGSKLRLNADCKFVC